MTTIDKALKLIDLDIIPMLYGDPGAAKSARIKAYAEEHNLKLYPVFLSHYQGTDLAGFPYVVDGEGKYAHFKDIIPMEDMKLPEGYEGFLLFFDELNLAEPDTLKVALQVLQDRKLGSKNLHPKCKIVCAGNRPDDNANLTESLPSAVINRMAVFTIEYDWTQWLEHMESLGHDRKIAELIYTFGDNTKGSTEQFLSPRSAEKLLWLYENDMWDHEYIDAIIGNNNASLWREGKRIKKLPDVLKEYTLKELSISYSPEAHRPIKKLLKNNTERYAYTKYLLDISTVDQAEYETLNQFIKDNYDE